MRRRTTNFCQASNPFRALGKKWSPAFSHSTSEILFFAARSTGGPKRRGYIADHLRRKYCVAPPNGPLFKGRLFHQTRDALTLFGLKIGKRRIARKMTVTAFAERVGVSGGVIRRIETGARGTGMGVAFAAARFVSLSLFEPRPTNMPSGSIAPAISRA